MQPDLIADRYRVVRAIGRGGMGTVWLCRDEVLRRDVAAKQMGALPGEDTESTTRAMREARVSAALNHENAVSVYDVVDHEHGTWLVMEYFPSQTLAELVSSGGALPPERVARIGTQVAAALASAHGLGIVHRDIKPGNILVGGNDVAKISDFGIARGHTDMSLTQTGMMTGTPGYFSPELAHGGDPSFASDAWALGATLFTAVEGHPAYPTQANPLAMLSMITRETPPRPEQAGPVGSVIEALMQHDPSQRWSMNQTRGALGRVADSGATDGHTRAFEVGAGAGLAGTAGTAAAAEEAGPADASGASVGAGAAGAAGAAAEMATAGDEPPPDGFTSGWQTAQEPVGPAPDTDPRRGWWIAAVVALIVLGIGAAAWAAFSPGDGSSQQNTPAADKKSQTHPTKQTNDPSTTAPNTTEATTTDPTTDTTEPTETTETTDSGGSPSGAASFVSNYYTLVPGDTDAGWSQLSPSFQAQEGRQDYDAFWSQYDSVSVTNVSAVIPTVVNYTISYDGSSPENKQITLVRSGPSYLIDSDGPQ